jgi:DNA-binding Lrp family transcriptional regulator
MYDLFMNLKDSDRQMINALKQNGRIPISKLAKQLGIARTTAQKRLDQLEANGIIQAYTVRLSDDSVSGTFQAYVNLEVNPHAASSITSALEKITEVEALFTVSGKIDFLAIVRVQSPAALDAVLDRISALAGVRDTRSALVLASKFDRR